MSSLSFDAARLPIRDDIAEALPQVWARIGQPGTWLTARERVAVAAESRNARHCRLCAERKEALSPYAVRGEHDSLGELPDDKVELVHRMMTDPARIAGHWFEALKDGGLPETEYVEIVGVIACTVAIDTFCRGIGMAPPPLPEPQDGAPSHETVGEEHLNRGLAFAPTLDPFVDGPLQKEFFPAGPPTAAHIRRALSSVPDTQRDFWRIANVLYMNGLQMRDFSTEYRAITHAQIELVAGRVSAINQCVY